MSIFGISFQANTLSVHNSLSRWVRFDLRQRALVIFFAIQDKLWILWTALAPEHAETHTQPNNSEIFEQDANCPQLIQESVNDGHWASLVLNPY